MGTMTFDGKTLNAQLVVGEIVDGIKRDDTIEISGDGAPAMLTQLRTFAADEAIVEPANPDRFQINPTVLLLDAEGQKTFKNNPAPLVLVKEIIRAADYTLPVIGSTPAAPAEQSEIVGENITR